MKHLAASKATHITHHATHTPVTGTLLSTQQKNICSRPTTPGNMQWTCRESPAPVLYNKKFVYTAGHVASQSILLLHAPVTLCTAVGMFVRYAGNLAIGVEMDLWVGGDRSWSMKAGATINTVRCCIIPMCVILYTIPYVGRVLVYPGKNSGNVIYIWNPCLYIYGTPAYYYY